MTTKRIVVPTQYKHCVITPANGGFDVFSGSRWFHTNTQKQAKWWAAVITRVETEFTRHAPRTAPVPVEDHSPKAGVQA